jgi:cyclohexanone monooxygenase
MITGPGSPSVLANVIAAIEQHVEWIVNFMEYARSQDIAEIDAEHTAEDEWVATVNGLAELTLYPHANSWYLGANIEGKPRVFMPYPGGMTAYRQTCDEVARSGYKGFTLTSGKEVRNDVNI